MSVFPPLMIDSAIPGMDDKYNVSSIAFQSSSPIKTAFSPLLFVIVIGVELALTSFINL